MPKVSRKGSFAVGEAGAKLEGAFESEAAMPKVSRTEAALSPKGRGADSGGKSEAAMPKAARRSR